MKICRRCFISKELDDFYKHPGMFDGHLNICKSCTRNRVFSYSQTDQGKLVEKKRNVGRKKYRALKLKEYRKKYPERTKAHAIVSRSIRHGKLIKKPCIVCGNVLSEAHHEDYLNPLDVIWYCRIHHRQRDKELGKYPKKF